LGFNNYKLSHDAYNVFRDFQFWIHEYKEQPDESFGYGMMTTLGKLEGIVARMSLVFHLMLADTRDSFMSETQLCASSSSIAFINISDLSRSLVMPSFLKTLTLERS
jgi:hypothetical protein